MCRASKKTICIVTLLAIVCSLLGASRAFAAKVFLNPSNQWSNAVCGGGNEADYALDVANRARTLLEAVGHTVIVDQDFTNAPGHANSWGADIFISIHSNAGGGHGIETLYSVSGDIPLAGDINAGLLGVGGHTHIINRGIKLRTNLYVLNNTYMPACLPEMLFHDCCPVEAPFLRTAGGRAILAAGIRNGVCAYFGGCQVCAPGTVESRSCPECGTQSRTCNAAGQWGTWTSCSGGGNRPCTRSNEQGSCPGLQACSAAGIWDVCQAPTPTAEVCDGQDNNCDGEVDEGAPVQMGAGAPAFAAELVDLSYPGSLRPGETTLAWALFENVGTATWRRHTLWLVSLTTLDGTFSRLWPGGSWPAWDVPSVIGHDVAPGDRALVAFDIRAPNDPGAQVTESFRLYDPTGEGLRCPTPEMTIALRVQRDAISVASTAPYGSATDLTGDGSQAADSNAQGGCQCGTVGGASHARGTAALALLLVIMLLFLGRRRRRHSA